MQAHASIDHFECAKTSYLSGYCGNAHERREKILTIHSVRAVGTVLDMLSKSFSCVSGEGGVALVHRE